MEQLLENNEEQQPQSEPQQEVRFKGPEEFKAPQESLSEKDNLDAEVYPDLPFNRPIEFAAPKMVYDIPEPSLKEVIVNLATVAPSKEWQLLNNILKIKFEKEYPTRVFAKLVKGTITELCQEHQIEAHGHTHLNSPYWVTDEGLLSEGAVTKYRTLDGTNVFVRIRQ